MSFATQARPKDRQPEYVDIEVSVGSAGMSPQPAELVLAPIWLKPKRRVEWIVDGLLPEFSIKAYCKLCLGAGFASRCVRAHRGPAVSRRRGDGRDDGSVGDDGGGGDGPPAPLAAAADLNFQTQTAASAATGEVWP